MDVSSISIRPPYLLFTGAEQNPSFAKTALGIVEWRRELCAGHLRTSESSIDLGLPSMSIAEAAEANIGSLIIGTASIGGVLPVEWIPCLEEALLAGIDVVGGLHIQLAHIDVLQKAAAKGQSKTIDVRVPPVDLPVGTGIKRTGLRLLTVGTDCAIGKKYTALALERDMRSAGLKVDFRATGQTGIMIAGRGISIDAVVGDFMSGAAELLSPDNVSDHWDVIEGQGALFHPGFAAVSHGLLLGSQPDAIVLCHDAIRTVVSGWPHVPLPSVSEAIERNILLARLTNPDVICAGISVNTSRLQGRERSDFLAKLSDQHGLPCVDPLIDGTSPIVEYLQSKFGHAGTSMTNMQGAR